LPPSGSPTGAARFQLRLDEVVWREVNGEVIVLEMGSGNYLNLNGSAGALWMALVEPVSVADLVGLLDETSSVSEEQVEADVRAFLDDLSQRSLVGPVA
jgi:hypothetical protein